MLKNIKGHNIHYLGKSSDHSSSMCRKNVGAKQIQIIPRRGVGITENSMIFDPLPFFEHLDSVNTSVAKKIDVISQIIDLEF
jgi:hypothetical protein